MKFWIIDRGWAGMSIIMANTKREAIILYIKNGAGSPYKHDLVENPSDEEVAKFENSFEEHDFAVNPMYNSFGDS